MPMVNPNAWDWAFIQAADRISGAWRYSQHFEDHRAPSERIV